MATELPDRADSLVGDGIEAAVAAKHRRRLRRLGAGARPAPAEPGGWAQARTPPRPGCELEVLIDGASALPGMASAIARRRGATSTSPAGTSRPASSSSASAGGPSSGALLAELAERIDVRILVWAGAPVPAFHPTRAEVREAVQSLVRGTRIRCETDPREHPFHCHHEKTIVDRRRAGLRRRHRPHRRRPVTGSTPQQHRARRRLGWHDVAHAPPRARGGGRGRPLRASLAGADRRAVEPAQPPAPRGGETTVQVVRTIAEGMYDHVPHGEFSVLESYVRGLARTRSG